MRSSLGLVIFTGLVALLAACKRDTEGTRTCATVAQCEAGEVCIDSLCRGCLTHAECPVPTLAARADRADRVLKAEGWRRDGVKNGEIQAKAIDR